MRWRLPRLIIQLEAILNRLRAQLEEFAFVRCLVRANSFMNELALVLKAHAHDQVLRQHLAVCDILAQFVYFGVHFVQLLSASTVVQILIDWEKPVDLFDLLGILLKCFKPLSGRDDSEHQVAIDECDDGSTLRTYLDFCDRVLATVSLR